MWWCALPSDCPKRAPEHIAHGGYVEQASRGSMHVEELSNPSPATVRRSTACCAGVFLLVIDARLAQGAESSNPLCMLNLARHTAQLIHQARLGLG